MMCAAFSITQEGEAVLSKHGESFVKGNARAASEPRAEILDIQGRPVQRQATAFSGGAPATSASPPPSDWPGLASFFTPDKPAGQVPSGHPPMDGESAAKSAASVKATVEALQPLLEAIVVGQKKINRKLDAQSESHKLLERNFTQEKIELRTITNEVQTLRQIVSAKTLGNVLAKLDA